MKRGFAVLALAAPLILAAQRPSDLIGEIEFFGYGKLDPAAMRKALSLRPGESVPEDTERLRAAIRRATGRKPTDYSPICCDGKGNRIIYLGLGGGAPFKYLRTPTGDIRLSKEAVDKMNASTVAWEDAVRRGVAGEDTSQGYSLGVDPALKASQLVLREYALTHYKEIVEVLDRSGDPNQRAMAATFLGYVRQSKAQIDGLLRAVRDPAEEVRNNATRALGVLAASSPDNARRIPPDLFVAMLRSGTWTDRNKAGYVLATLTAPRDPKTLGALRSKALPELIEMARWETNHALMFRIVLGRVAGLPDDRLFPLAVNGPAEEIVRAARGS